MAINVPSRDALNSRQARPLNGIEINDAIENHILTLATRLLDKAGVLSDDILPLLDYLKESFRFSTINQTRLHKIHVTYPRAGWSIKIRIEELDAPTIINGSSLSHIVGGEIEVDLERNVRISLRFGRSGEGVVLSSLEDEKIPTQVPDRDRQRFDLPITAEFLKPDGTTGKVDIRDLQPKERKAARTVDVGSGAVDRRPITVSDQQDNGAIYTREVMAAPGGEGNVISLPDPSVEISLDDVVATPPSVPQEPISTPLPLSPMSKMSKPNVKFRR